MILQISIKSMAKDIKKKKNEQTNANLTKRLWSKLYEEK